MMQTTNRTRQGPATERQCQGSKSCSSFGTSYTTPVFVVGAPDSRTVCKCLLCNHFVCGVCAKKDCVNLSASGTTLVAWSLLCPHCGSPLGDEQAGQGVLLSSELGMLAGVKETAAAWLVDQQEADATERLRNALDYHQRRAWRILYTFNAERTLDGMIGVTDKAVAECPTDDVAWLYKALLSDKAGYAVAAKAALERLQRQAAAGPASRPVSCSVIELLDDNFVSFAVSCVRWFPKPRLSPLACRVFPAVKRLGAWESQLREELGQVSNPELGAFLQRVNSYRVSDLRIGEYLRLLFRDTPQTPPAVEGFLRALDYEESLDFKKVEEDRSTVLKTLVERLSKEDVDRLLRMSVAYRLGGVAHPKFYRYLGNLMEQQGIGLDDYPHFRDYFRYQALAGTVDVRIFEALWDEEQRVFAELVKSAREQALIDDLNRAYLVKNLFDYLGGNLSPIRSWKFAENSEMLPEWFGKEKRRKVRRFLWRPTCLPDRNRRYVWQWLKLARVVQHLRDNGTWEDVGWDTIIFPRVRR